MLVLVRKGTEVYHDKTKLTIVEQKTKGSGKEVVKIDGLDGSNGQKWISLSKLVEGKNEVSCKGREVTSTGSYTLTPAEKLEVDALQLQIDAIKDAAKARYVPKSVDPRKMSADELEAYITKLRKSLKG